MDWRGLFFYSISGFQIVLNSFILVALSVSRQMAKYLILKPCLKRKHDFCSNRFLIYGLPLNLGLFFINSRILSRLFFVSGGAWGGGAPGQRFSVRFDGKLSIKLLYVGLFGRGHQRDNLPSRTHPACPSRTVNKGGQLLRKVIVDQNHARAAYFFRSAGTDFSFAFNLEYPEGHIAKSEKDPGPKTRIFLS